MFLVDTNVWLEGLLEQSRSEEAVKFLRETSSDRLFITDFAFHSIGLIMSRLNRIEAFLRFIQDTLVSGEVELIHLQPDDMRLIAERAQQFRLDFDDAYQYVAAEKENLTIGSFDGDFDRTSRGRKTPAEAMRE